MQRGCEWSIDRTCYDQLLGLSYAGWSWEFKRRDPALRKAVLHARTHRPIILKRPDGCQLIRLRRRCPEAEAFGLQFFPDPDRSALEIRPFWIPEVLTKSLDAIIELKHQARAHAEPLRWDHLPGEKHFLIGPGRRPKLLIASQGYAAQLAIDEQTVPVPQALFLSIKIGAAQMDAGKLKPIEEFARFCSGSAIVREPLRGRAPEALRDALIALDGHLAGATQRQIAGEIFGAECVEEDWATGVKSYKSRTRRLIQKGVELMENGYRNLL